MNGKCTLELGRCEGFGLQRNFKHLIVDKNRSTGNLKVGRGKRDTTPVKPSGLSSLSDESAEQLVPRGKCDDPRKRRISSKLEMRPPKMIRTAILLTVGPDGSSQSMCFDTLKSKESTSDPYIHGSYLQEISVSQEFTGNINHVSSSKCEVLANGKYDVEQVPLVDTKQRDNTGSELKENGLKDIKDFVKAKSTKIKAQIEKSKTSGVAMPFAHKQKLEDRDELSNVGPSGSNTLQSDLKRQEVSDSGFRPLGQMGGKGNDSARLMSVESETRSPIHSPESEFAAFVSRVPHDDHNKVEEILNMFKDALANKLKENKAKPRGQAKHACQIYIDVAMLLIKQQKCVNQKDTIGDLPGIKVGDCFQCRAELVIIGLHRKFTAGIDYMEMDGKLVATSIVASGRYPNEVDSSDVLIYFGEGGNLATANKEPEDQKLVRGNLALKNSFDAKLPVRVIRGRQTLMGLKSLDANTIKESKFVYDGLYIVSNYVREKGQGGKLVFKFQLNRIPEQPKLAWSMVNHRSTKRTMLRNRVILDDISQKKEKVPVRVVNDVDSERPPRFEYISEMVYPEQYDLGCCPSDCDCTNPYSNLIQCPCAIKTRVELPSEDGVAVGKKPIVYECGPSCQCPPTCKNRKSQHGIHLQLEVFKTKSNEWGVRARNYISADCFVCEYIGELLQYVARIHDTNQVLENKPMACSHLQLSSSKNVEGFANDALRFGNVGRFIRHSCSPNLYAKYVLFDHDDTRRPHVMLFAAKKIPPSRELTWDYNVN